MCELKETLLLFEFLVWSFVLFDSVTSHFSGASQFSSSSCSVKTSIGTTASDFQCQPQDVGRHWTGTWNDVAVLVGTWFAIDKNIRHLSSYKLFATVLSTVCDLFLFLIHILSNGHSTTLLKCNNELINSIIAILKVETRPVSQYFQNRLSHEIQNIFKDVKQLTM